MWWLKFGQELHIDCRKLTLTSSLSTGAGGEVNEVILDWGCRPPGRERKEFLKGKQSNLSFDLSDLKAGAERELG